MKYWPEFKTPAFANDGRTLCSCDSRAITAQFLPVGLQARCLPASRRVLALRYDHRDPGHNNGSIDQQVTPGRPIRRCSAWQIGKDWNQRRMSELLIAFTQIVWICNTLKASLQHSVCVNTYQCQHACFWCCELPKKQFTLGRFSDLKICRLKYYQANQELAIIACALHLANFKKPDTSDYLGLKIAFIRKQETDTTVIINTSSPGSPGSPLSPFGPGSPGGPMPPTSPGRPFCP